MTIRFHRNAFLSVVVACALALVNSAEAASKSKREFLQSDAALARLGRHADKFAKRYQLQDADQLKQVLRQDRTLKLSIRKIEGPKVLDNEADASDAELLFADVVPEHALTAGGAELPNSPVATHIPDTQTFMLHSKLGARGTLWINFKGETTTSAYWNDGNTVNAGSYTLDSNNDFSSTELANIKNMWLQVAEDYAAFDVDVTTEKPTNPDLTHYIEVVVTMTDDWYPDAGGVCYVNSFGWSSANGKMCFVFPNALVKNTKYTAEAIAHEAGHSFGLYHWSHYDSTGKLLDSYYPGTSTWGPIMGGAYTSQITTWSKGDYPNAGTSNGFGKTQDDLNVIRNKIGGTGLVDEAGSDKNNSAAMAGTVNNGTLMVSQQGVVSSQTDFDVFKMSTAGGDLALTIKPAAVQPNLDFQVRVLNEASQVLFTANPDKVASVSVTLNGLAAGNYYVEISPMGFGDPLAGGGYPAYSSSGRYYITGTLSGAGSGGPSPSPTPGPGTGCTRSGWNSTTCNGVTRKISRVSVL